MSDTKDTIKERIIKRINRMAEDLKSDEPPKPLPIPDNVVELPTKLPDLDDTFLFCNKCGCAAFIITGAFQVQCGECRNLVIDLSNFVSKN